MLLIKSCAFSTFNGEFNFLTIENTIYCRLYGENTAQGVLQHRPWVEGFGELGGGGDVGWDEAPDPPYYGIQ